MALAFSGRFAAEDLIFGTNLRDLEIALQDGGAALYGITGLNGGISRWQLAADGGLPQLQGQQLHGEASLRTGPFQLAETSGGLRLLQGQISQSELAFYPLADDGSLGSQQHAALAGADAGGFGAVAMLPLAAGGAVFYGVGAASGRLQGWQLAADGAVRAAAETAGSSSAYSLDPAALLAIVPGPSGPLQLAADAQGLHSFRADAASGALSPGAELGAEQGLAVSGVTALEGFEADGTAWALLAAAGSSSLTLVQVKEDGDLRFAAQLQDTAMTRFGGVAALEVVEAEGHILVLAAGNDGGLSLFTLAPGGALIHLQSLEHRPGLGLQNVTALEAAVSGAHLQVFAASDAEGGISQFTLPLADLGQRRSAAAGAERLDGSSGNDLLAGGLSSASLYGQAGDDVLVAGAGGGALRGGSGADIFVINPAAERVTVRDFTPGEDQLDLSLFEGLRHISQLTTQARSSGMVMEADGTRIVLISGGGSPLTLQDVFGADLRFAFPQPQDLGVTLPGGSFTGTARGDRLAGTGGADEIAGGGGRDMLQGNGGADRLAGGKGADTLRGGEAGDRLFGQSHADLLRGGSGADTLRGGKGHDRLDGGRGADWLEGNAGADVFVFARGHGRDSIADFTPGRDLISLKAAAAGRFADLELSRQDGGTLIGTGSGQIFLEDLRPGQLEADDFLF